MLVEAGDLVVRRLQAERLGDHRGGGTEQLAPPREPRQQPQLADVVGDLLQVGERQGIPGLRRALDLAAELRGRAAERGTKRAPHRALALALAHAEVARHGEHALLPPREIPQLAPIDLRRQLALAQAGDHAADVCRRDAGLGRAHVGSGRPALRGGSR